MKTIQVVTSSPKGVPFKRKSILVGCVTTAPAFLGQGEYAGTRLAPLKAELLPFWEPFGPVLGRFGHKWAFPPNGQFWAQTMRQNKVPQKCSSTLWEGKRGIFRPFKACFDCSANVTSMVKVWSRVHVGVGEGCRLLQPSPHNTNKQQQQRQALHDTDSGKKNCQQATPLFAQTWPLQNPEPTANPLRRPQRWATQEGGGVQKWPKAAQNGPLRCHATPGSLRCASNPLG